MGLLDTLNDPAMGGLLAGLAASGPSSRPVGLGQVLNQGYQGFQQAQDHQSNRAARGQDMQLKKMQLGQLLQSQQGRQLFRSKLPPEMQSMFDVDPEGVIKSMFKQEESYTLNQGDRRYRGDKLIAEGAPKQEAMPEFVRLQQAHAGMPEGPMKVQLGQKLQTMSTHSPPIAVNNYPQPMAVTKPDGSVGMVQFGSKGDMRETPYTPAPVVREPKAPTEFEGKAAFFAGNMKAASKVLDKLESEGMNMSAIGNQADTALAGGIGNAIASPRAQQARQAQKQWAEQMLRMQTGAAAPEPEVVRVVSTYFPQIGDSAEVVAQKREQRAQAESGVQSASGRAESRIPDQAKPPTTFDAMPPAQKYKGKRIQGDDGTTYRSDGMRWVKE